MDVLPQDADLPRSDAPAAAARQVPAVASRRGYLRGGLPAVYQEGEFAMRFVGGLETVIDPIVAMIDALPAHFSAELAPADVLELMAAWVGVALDESHSDEQRREVVRSAASLSRQRGTKAGLELALRLTFRDVELRVEDRGRVTWARDASTPGPQAGGFVVYCETPLSDARLRAVAALVDHFKPVDAGYQMKVKRSASQTGETS